MGVECECFLVHQCRETERSTTPLTWRGVLVFVGFPVLLVVGFAVLIGSLS